MCKCISIALKYDEIHQKDNGSIFPGHKQSRGSLDVINHWKWFICLFLQREDAQCNAINSNCSGRSISLYPWRLSQLEQFRKNYSPSTPIPTPIPIHAQDTKLQKCLFTPFEDLQRNRLTHHCNELVEQNHLPACNNPRTQSNSRTLALTPFNRFHNTVFLSTSFLFAFFCNANLRSYLILMFTLEMMSNVWNLVFIGLYFLPL